MTSAIFCIVIINSFYWKENINDRTQSTSGENLELSQEKKEKIITFIQLQSKAPMPANIPDFLQKLAMYYAPKTQELGPQDGN